MRCLRIVPCILLAATLAGCGKEPVTPTEDVLIATFNAGGTDRPFKAEVEGLVSFGPDLVGRCPVGTLGFITYSTGTGQATHLGEIELISSHCPAPPGGEPPPYGLSKAGEATFVAANGDELYATYEGEQLTPDFADPTLVTSEYVFVGGTGRFSNATGWAHIEGVARLPEDPFTQAWPVKLTFQGRISY